MPISGLRRVAIACSLAGAEGMRIGGSGTCSGVGAAVCCSGVAGQGEGLSMCVGKASGVMIVIGTSIFAGDGAAAGWLAGAAACCVAGALAIAAGSDWRLLRCDQYVSAEIHNCGPPQYDHAVLSGPVSDDFYAVLYGDVTGNWSPAAQGLAADAAATWLL